MAKITRMTMNNWVTSLEETIEAKEEALSNASDADSPNDERIEKLETEIQMLEEILDAVQSYIEL